MSFEADGADVSEHTPGPWRHEETERGWGVLGPGELQHVADIAGYAEQPEEADARLIAVAPELLEAAEDLLDGREWIESDTDMRAWVRLLAAVAKAKEGE